MTTEARVGPIRSGRRGRHRARKSGIAGRFAAWIARGSGLPVGVLVVATTAVSFSSPSVWADTVEVHPSWENAPWEAKTQTILNVTAQIGLACCVLSFLLGGAAMGAGRIIGSYQAGSRGLQLILGGGGGALVIASAASIVSWLIS